MGRLGAEGGTRFGIEGRGWGAAIAHQRGREIVVFFFFSSRRRHTRLQGDWSSDVCSSDLDLPGANLDRVKKQLQDRGLTPEDWGGETIICPVSATKGTGIDQLLEMMSLQAEVMELKASPTARPRGTVIEAQVEAGRGPTATVIVQMGTLKVGDPFICGDYSGKVKSLLDDRGEPIKEAGPSMPVKVLGFTGLPNAGDELLVMDSEREAIQLSEERLASNRAGKS